MAKCVLRNKDGVMVKSIDRVNCTLELTTDIEEALHYPQGEWFAKTELEYLQFHMGKEHPELETMAAQYEKLSNDWDDAIVEVGNAVGVAAN